MPREHQYTLAQLTQGLNVTIKGDPNVLIQGVCAIQESQAGFITFLTNPLYKKYLPVTQAAAVILSPEHADLCATNAIISADPYYTYAKIARYFSPKSTVAAGIHPTAVIGQDANLDPTATISAHCVIGQRVTIGANVILGPACVVGDDTHIGADTHIDAQVTIYARIQIGERVRIASGTVIGSDGFGFAKNQGVWHKIPQLGTVIIEDDVDIGANCAIDRGAIENTVIERGVKLDNHIQIGHNAHIGAHTIMAGCVGVAGSAVIGKHCLIGGGTGIGGHITIPDNVAVTGMTAVTKSITQPGVYSSGVGGLVTNQEWRKNSARVQRLEKLMDRVKVLEIALAALIERTPQ